MNKWPKVMASLAFLSPILGWRSGRRYLQLDGLPALSRQSLPSLSIIVPARNEADNLQRLLPSLLDLDYDGQVEVIVVDDGSTDQTVAIARSFGVKVFSLKSLPPEWHGKPYACHMGAEGAGGDWLLFTDADTIHTANGPARAVSYALDHGLDGLSTFLKQEFRGLTDRLALQVAFAGLFASLPDRHAMLNGQYILLQRGVYQAINGFASVRSDPLEDLALGHRLYSMGYHVPMVRGESLAHVAMYSGWSQMWHGMARIGAGTLRWSGASGLVAALFITAVMTPLLVMALSAARLLGLRWVPLTWAASVAGFWPTSLSFGQRRQLLLVPAGALFVQAAAMYGLLNRIARRSLDWKGRAI